MISDMSLIDPSQFLVEKMNHQNACEELESNILEYKILAYFHSLQTHVLLPQKNHYYLPPER